MRKGMTLVELTFVLVIIGILSYFAVGKIHAMRYENAVEKMFDDSGKELETGIFNPFIGYVSKRNSSCSMLGYYNDMTAYRIANCSTLSNHDMVYTGSSETDEKDGTKSYFEYMVTWGNTGKGCRKYYQEDSNNSKSFEVFIDCSDLPLSLSEGLEYDFLSYYKNNYDTILKSYNDKATSFDTEGGTDTDNMILFVFEK